MSPIDTDVSTPPPLLRSNSSSTQFSPLTPGSAIASALDLPTIAKNEDSNNTHPRRSILLLKSPTSPTATFWKRSPYFYPTSAGNLRVLLVDDNEVNLQVLTKVLKIHMADVFHQLDTVISAESAIEKLQQDTYDMILMDIDMPGLNGVEATSWIRRGHQQEQQDHDLDIVLSQNRRIPIVAVTTNISLEWKKAYLKVGMNGCIPKPISPYILRHSLTQVLMYGSYWDYSDA
ncbi:CheY-like superfamily [Chlamydoabsidia padenii]|nr:CheY-like superfamily [Chlamydoabsidia padenii]